MSFSLADIGSGEYPAAPATESQRAVNAKNNANWQAAQTRLAALEAGGVGGGGGGSVAGYSAATPGLLRGTVQGHMWPSVVKGAVSAAQRTANGAALQAALVYARDNAKFFELEPGRYEYTLAAGLKVEGDGLVWRGSRSTELWNYADNGPVVVIGREPATNNGYFGMDVQGLSAYHGNPQTAAQTDAVGILMRSAWQGSFRQLQSGWAPGGFTMGRPNWAILFSGTGGDSWWFDNTMEDCKFGHGWAGSFKHALMSTANRFSNIHLGAGNPVATTFTEAMMSFDENYARGQGNSFSKINIEWAKGPQMLRLNVCKNFHFDTLHFEGCEPAGGAGANFVYGIYSSGSFHEVDFENCAVLAANVTGGQAALFGGYGACRFDVRGLKWEPKVPATQDDAARVDMDWRLWAAPDGDEDGLASFSAEGLEFATTAAGRAFGQLGPDTPKASFRRPDAVRSYEWGRARGDRLRGAVLQLADADYTHHGLSEDATLLVPATLSSARTLVLSDRLGPSGWRAAVPPRTGSVVRVRRQAGTYANPLTVKTGTAGGATVGTLGAANSEMLAFFNGIAWTGV